MPQDYYSLLGVKKTAGQAELKAAYHREAKKYHPDRNTGDPAAEERFKAVAEAWRVLGNAERRADYDAQAERRIRYSSAPELSAMPHHTRLSRHSRERRMGERRRERAARPARTRLFLINRRKPMGLWGMVAVYVFCVLMILPPLIRVMHPATLPAAHRRATEHRETEEKHHPAEVVQQRLLQQAEQVRAAAEQGDASAQMRYGLMLYNGLGIPMNRPAARIWWERSAAQGNTAAAAYLSHWTENPPPAEDNAADPPPAVCE